ncbi:MAG TPA: hypothetical protein VGQ34_00010 [Sphingomicrobium sp.]|jgi:cadmium resistance protein CadD (predicted permease)|nr:hypothetical protein [Sphingomicrobium sp.]
MTRFSEVTEHSGGDWSYRAGVVVAIAAAVLTVWTTIVRDDGNGIGFLMLVVAALVGAFSAWFQPAGMARAMLGIAVMQALLGIAVATAPSTASMPDGSFKALMFSCIFVALWLISAIFFRTASKRRSDCGAAH